MSIRTVLELRYGRINVVNWKNEGLDGTGHSMSIVVFGIYKHSNKDVWRETHRLGRDRAEWTETTVPPARFRVSFPFPLLERSFAMCNLKNAHRELFRRQPDECFSSLPTLWQRCHEQKGAMNRAVAFI